MLRSSCTSALALIQQNGLRAVNTTWHRLPPAIAQPISFSSLLNRSIATTTNLNQAFASSSSSSSSASPSSTSAAQTPAADSATITATPTRPLKPGQKRRAIVERAGGPQRTHKRPVSARQKAKLKPVDLAKYPPESPVLSPGAQAAMPKQKVQMYSKLLRVVRSASRGAIKNTAGDDYVLDGEEKQSVHSQFTGLVSANLSGLGRSKKRAKSGKESGRSYGKGGRKSARAHVWIQKSMTRATGDFYVNGLRYVEYFTELSHRWEICSPFYVTHTLTDFDMIAVVRGGGRSGQAGAIKHAAAKALQAFDRRKYRGLLKRKFLLSRDTRVVERKKYGQKKARKKFTFVKR